MVRRDDEACSRGARGEQRSDLADTSRERHVELLACARLPWADEALVDHVGQEAGEEFDERPAAQEPVNITCIPHHVRPRVDGVQNREHLDYHATRIAEPKQRSVRTPATEPGHRPDEQRYPVGPEREPVNPCHLTARCAQSVLEASGHRGDTCAGLTANQQ